LELNWEEKLESTDRERERVSEKQGVREGETPQHPGLGLEVFRARSTGIS